MRKKSRRQYIGGTRKKEPGKLTVQEQEAEAQMRAQERRLKDANDAVKLSEFKPASFWKD